MARVRIDGREYQSEPTDLVRGVNLVPVKVGDLTRYVVVGGPILRSPDGKPYGGGE